MMATVKESSVPELMNWKTFSTSGSIEENCSNRKIQISFVDDDSIRDFLGSKPTVF